MVSLGLLWAGFFCHLVWGDDRWCGFQTGDVADLSKAVNVPPCVQGGVCNCVQPHTAAYRDKSITVCCVMSRFEDCEDTIVWGQLAGCRGTGVILVCLIKRESAAYAQCARGRGAAAHEVCSRIRINTQTHMPMKN